MKTANCTLQVTATKKTAYLDFYIERTSNEIFSMGNSSLLLNLDKKIFTDGVITFQAKKFTSRGYEPLEFVQYSFNAIGLQFRCNTLGREIPTVKTHLATLKFSLNGTASKVTWRLIDSAIVTPNFETVDSTYFINLK